MEVLLLVLVGLGVAVVVSYSCEVPVGTSSCFVGYQQVPVAVVSKSSPDKVMPDFAKGSNTGDGNGNRLTRLQCLDVLQQNVVPSDSSRALAQTMTDSIRACLHPNAVSTA